MDKKASLCTLRAGLGLNYLYSIKRALLASESRSDVPIDVSLRDDVDGDKRECSTMGRVTCYNIMPNRETTTIVSFII